MKKFDECNERIFQCLWRGTNELLTRSKYPQRSILYIEILYKDKIYNDLPDLVKEGDYLKNRVVSLGPKPFDFEKLIVVIKERQKEVEKVRIKGCLEITKEVDNMISRVPKGLVEQIVT